MSEAAITYLVLACLGVVIAALLWRIRRADNAHDDAQRERGRRVRKWWNNR